MFSLGTYIAFMDAIFLFWFFFLFFVRFPFARLPVARQPLSMAVHTSGHKGRASLAGRGLYACTCDLIFIYKYQTRTRTLFKRVK